MGETATVTGQVRFVKKSTLVPNVQCNDFPCGKSRKYWALAIQTENKKYSLERGPQYFQEEAPESISLNGVPLRPGAIVRFEGQVVALNESLYSVLNVQSVSLVMDAEWICKTIEENGPKVKVHVWYQNHKNSVGGFKLRIDAVENHKYFPIARVERAFFKDYTHDEVSQWVIKGENADTSFLLQLTPQFNQLKDIPGSLAVVNRNHTGLRNFPILSELQMSCIQAKGLPIVE
jgi:hypothetical protein